MSVSLRLWTELRYLRTHRKACVKSKLLDGAAYVQVAVVKRGMNECKLLFAPYDSSTTRYDTASTCLSDAVLSETNGFM